MLITNLHRLHFWIPSVVVKPMVSSNLIQWTRKLTFTLRILPLLHLTRFSLSSSLNLFHNRRDYSAVALYLSTKDSGCCIGLNWHLLNSHKGIRYPTDFKHPLGVPFNFLTNHHQRMHPLIIHYCSMIDISRTIGPSHSQRISNLMEQ